MPRLASAIGLASDARGALRRAAVVPGAGPVGRLRAPEVAGSENPSGPREGREQGVHRPARGA
eukprot:7718387-Alexandrium_andersonii.AAC.1